MFAFNYCRQIIALLQVLILEKLLEHKVANISALLLKAFPVFAPVSFTVVLFMTCINLERLQI